MNEDEKNKGGHKKNRLCVYFFYDAEGIVDRYVDYYLKELSKVIDRLIVVVNGKLSPEGRDVFSRFTDEIIVRENTGFDVWAYKTALEYVGWEELGEYYEVILGNHTVMGPVYPFEDMFGEMDKRNKLDFWGITKYLRQDINLDGACPYGFILEYIQSHFTVYRNTFIKSRELRDYWEHVPLIQSYNDSVAKHESYFTKYFGDMGFRWDTYVNNSAEKDFNVYLLMAAPRKALSEYKCPVFKRKSFFLDHGQNLYDSIGEPASELLRFLQTETSYDTDMIFENIIRTCNMADIVYNLGLFYVLPENAPTGIALSNDEQKKCALIMHIYYLDIVEEAARYAASMPPGADIYITTPFEKQKSEIERVFSVLSNKVVVRIVENRGRDVSALLVGCADVIRDYKYICFWHDKKTKQAKPESIGRSWSYKISHSVLATETYVCNVIRHFEKNPFLGILSPLPPTHGIFFTIGGSGEWGSNYENTKTLAEKLDIHVPISRDIPPVAPLGTVFWFRGEALRPLAEYGWKYTDFPEEPNANDGTILHAIERIYGYAAQKQGYLTAYLTTDKIASFEFAAYVKYWRGYCEVARQASIGGAESYVRFMLQKRLRQPTSLKARLRLRLKRMLPKWMYGMIVRTKRLFFGPHGINIFLWLICMRI